MELTILCEGLVRPLQSHLTLCNGECVGCGCIFVLIRICNSYTNRIGSCIGRLISCICAVSRCGSLILNTIACILETGNCRIRFSLAVCPTVHGDLGILQLLLGNGQGACCANLDGVVLCSAVCADGDRNLGAGCCRCGVVAGDSRELKLLRIRFVVSTLEAGEGDHSESLRLITAILQRHGLTGNGQLCLCDGELAFYKGICVVVIVCIGRRGRFDDRFNGVLTNIAKLLVRGSVIQFTKACKGLSSNQSGRCCVLSGHCCTVDDGIVLALNDDRLLCNVEGLGDLDGLCSTGSRCSRNRNGCLCSVIACVLRCAGKCCAGCGFTGVVLDLGIHRSAGFLSEFLRIFQRCFNRRTIIGLVGSLQGEGDLVIIQRAVCCNTASSDQSIIRCTLSVGECVGVCGDSISNALDCNCIACFIGKILLFLNSQCAHRSRRNRLLQTCNYCILGICRIGDRVRGIVANVVFENIILDIQTSCRVFNVDGSDAAILENLICFLDTCRNNLHEIREGNLGLCSSAIITSQYALAIHYKLVQNGHILNLVLGEGVGVGGGGAGAGFGYGIIIGRDERIATVLEYQRSGCGDGEGCGVLDGAVLYSRSASSSCLDLNGFGTRLIGCLGICTDICHRQRVLMSYGAGLEGLVRCSIVIQNTLIDIGVVCRAIECLYVSLGISIRGKAVAVAGQRRHGKRFDRCLIAGIDLHRHTICAVKLHTAELTDHIAGVEICYILIIIILLASCKHIRISLCTDTRFEVYANVCLNDTSLNGTPCIFSPLLRNCEGQCAVFCELGRADILAALEAERTAGMSVGLRLHRRVDDLGVLRELTLPCVGTVSILHSNAVDLALLGGVLYDCKVLGCGDGDAAGNIRPLAVLRRKGTGADLDNLRYSTARIGQGTGGLVDLVHSLIINFNRLGCVLCGVDEDVVRLLLKLRADIAGIGTAGDVEGVFAVFSLGIGGVFISSFCCIAFSSDCTRTRFAIECTILDGEGNLVSSLIIEFDCCAACSLERTIFDGDGAVLGFDDTGSALNCTALDIQVAVAMEMYKLGAFNISIGIDVNCYRGFTSGRFRASISEIHRMWRVHLAVNIHGKSPKHLRFLTTITASIDNNATVVTRAGFLDKNILLQIQYIAIVLLPTFILKIERI